MVKKREVSSKPSGNRKVAPFFGRLQKSKNIKGGDPHKMSNISIKLDINMYQCCPIFLNFAQFSKRKKISKEPKFEVSSSVNKNLAQKSGFKKVWKILQAQDSFLE